MDVTIDRLAIVQRDLDRIIAGEQPAQALAIDCSRLLPHVDFLFSTQTLVNDAFAPHAMSITRWVNGAVDPTYPGQVFVSGQDQGIVVQLYDANKVPLPNAVTGPFVAGRWQGYFKLASLTGQHAYIALIAQDTVNIALQGSWWVVEWVPR